MANEQQKAPQAVIVMLPKSVGLAILLTVLFGPLGMLYSTIWGAVIMFIPSLVVLVVGFLTFGFGLLGLIVIWPISIVWAAVAVKSYNKKLLCQPTSPSSPMLPEQKGLSSKPEEVIGMPSPDVAPSPKNLRDVGTCPNCKATISETAKFCNNCGAKVEKVICPHCGLEVNPGAKFCGSCGKNLT
jgi:hypothetical protein